MARRSSGGSGLELVLVAIAAAAFAIIVAVPYALAILLYALPFFLVWLRIPTKIGTEPQLVIDSSPHLQLAEFRAQMRHARDQSEHIRYGDWGIRWSDNLGRFEERSIRGRELNDKWQYWESETDRVGAEIRDVERPETSAFTAWSREIYSWNRQHALSAAKRAAFGQMLVALFGIWGAAELVGLAYPDFIRLFAFAWNPLPKYLHPGIAIGAAVAWATGIYRLNNPPKLFAERAAAQIRGYHNAKRMREEQEDRQTTYSSSEDSFEDVDDEEAGDEGASDDQEEFAQSTVAWHEVLKVDPKKSTLDEIKAAYKRAAMACHPDKVAHMNEHIRQVAKEEMQKLNDAFEQAKTARGFS